MQTAKELQTLPRQVATVDTFSRLYPSDAMTRARDERQGQQYETFSGVAPDQLCYYFYQAVAPAENL